MILDNETWQHYRARFLAVEGPRRAEPIAETLRPGDVLDTGEVILDSGAFCLEHTHGIWLEVDQAHRAAYYGWQHVQGAWSRNPKCETLLLVVRTGWPKLA